MCFNNFCDKILAIIARKLPNTDDKNLLNLREREQMFNLIRSLLFLPSNLQSLGLDILSGHIESYMSSLSLEMMNEFRNEFFQKFDSKGVPGSFDTIELFSCLSNEKSVSFDADWPEKY